MAYVSTCKDPTCGVVVDGDQSVCPKCGGPMRGVGEAPWRGWVLVALGLFLILFMGAIAWVMSPILLFPERAIEAGDFTGTVEMAHMILLLFAAVILFGCVATANGIYMLATKKQSVGFIVATLGLAAALVAIGFLAMGSGKNP